jgi:predicted NUDIX family NTP pyrophosphohydrolase
MAKSSAGLLLFRIESRRLHVLLVHPGGPFWQRRDDGAWSIPKGEFEPGEDALQAARREFEEEMGFAPPGGDAIELEAVRQTSGKVVQSWAIEGGCDIASVKSNTFSMEWPPRSGRMQSFPEIDRAAWFTLEAARSKILKGQAPLLEQLAEKVRGHIDTDAEQGQR